MAPITTIHEEDGTCAMFEEGEIRTLMVEDADLLGDFLKMFAFEDQLSTNISIEYWLPWYEPITSVSSMNITAQIRTRAMKTFGDTCLEK